MSDHQDVQLVDLCNSADLTERGDAVPFEVVYCGRVTRAFVVRFNGQVHAYLNRCGHVPMEMDYQPNRFFDLTGNYLMCATHGALYRPETGECRGGPCQRGLVKIVVSEKDGQVHWHTAPNLQPLAF